MSKIVYPETDTLANLVKNPIMDSQKALTQAISYCTYSIPYGFAYLNYLKTLGNKIAELRAESYSIYGAIEKIDFAYQNAFDTLDLYKDGLDLTIIEERDRLVK